MRFWEHIFDFQTAVNVPLRNIVILQHLDALRRKGLGRFALTGILHDLERLFRLNALVQQIGHDAVTGPDDIRNGAGAVVDEILGVAQPYVRSVGQTGNLQKVAELLGLGIQQHLDGKARAHFRNSQTAGLAVDFFRRNAQHRGIRTHLNDLGICGGNVVDGESGCLLQVLIHGGDDVSQFVQFQDGIVQGVEVEVGS